MPHSGHSHCNHDHHHHTAEGRIGLAFWLNSAFAIVEIVGGLYSNSFAVVSNALHDLGDSAALFIAFSLEKKSKSTVDADYSYGYRRYSIVSAFLTAVLLVSGAVLVICFSIQSLFIQRELNLDGMLLLSILGIAMNGITLLRLKKGKSWNEKVLAWHFVEDTLNWALVLVGSLFMRWKNWYWLDTSIGILVSCWILWNVRKNLYEIVRIFLQATPRGFSTSEIQKKLCQISGVKNVHHLHLWSLDGEKHILTAHVLIDGSQSAQDQIELKAILKKDLLQTFAITEATLEFEYPNEICLDPIHQ